MDVLLGEYWRNNSESNPEDRNDVVDLGSDRPRQGMIQNSEEFRSLLNSNSGENSEITIETARAIDSESTNQV